MKYVNTVRGRFIDRPNRFVAHVEVDGCVETVHVKNTGRCKELLLSGAEVTLAVSDNPLRRTKYDLISVLKKGVGWINIDSQAPNVVVREWLEGAQDLFPNITLLKPEHTYGKSRVDFYLECGRRKIFIEVKGCTLEINKVGYFPDAPTERGVKHLRELTKAVEEGYECYVAFVIAMPDVMQVLPNRVTHPEFGTALDEAVRGGVKVLFLPCCVTPDELTIKEYVLKTDVARRVNITAGECLNDILRQKFPGEHFVPFNEAMLHGACSAPLFSDGFIRERAAFHKVSEDEYREKQSGFLNVLEHSEEYDEIVLWFGDEPFCVENRRAVLEALKNRGYGGKLLLNIVDEETGEVLKRCIP